MLGFVCWYVRLERLTLLIAFVSPTKTRLKSHLLIYPETSVKPQSFDHMWDCGLILLLPEQHGCISEG